MINVEQVQGHWETIRGKLKEKWGQLTDDDLRIVGGNVDQLVGAIERKTGEARANVERFINDMMDDEATLLNRAQGAASNYRRLAAERVQQGYLRLNGQVRGGYARAERQVREHPVQATAAAFGLGLIAGLALGLAARSNAD